MVSTYSQARPRFGIIDVSQLQMQISVFEASGFLQHARLDLGVQKDTASIKGNDFRKLGKTGQAILA